MGLPLLAFSAMTLSATSAVSTNTMISDALTLRGMCVLCSASIGPDRISETHPFGLFLLAGTLL
jgi:hypothetical protein